MSLQDKTFCNSDIKTYCVPHLLSHCEASDIINCAEKHFIAEILLNYCEYCDKMASLPHGAFAAYKMRKHYPQEDMLVSHSKSANANEKKDDTKNSTNNKKLLEYSPLKYNEKLMNSIWGFYNRYSPHNIKGNEYESVEQRLNMQQHKIAVAPYVIAEEMAMAFHSGKEWCFTEK